MDSKNAITFDQVPHVVSNHPNTTPEHWGIMMVLYKVLKDNAECIYSDEKLSKRTRTPIRTLRRRLSELEEFGLIQRIGDRQNRRFRLGKLFNTSAKMADKKLPTSANMADASAKNANYIGQNGRYTNNILLRTNTKGVSLSSNPKKQKELELEYNEYHGEIMSLRRLKLTDEEPLSPEEWLNSKQTEEV
jgi:DNA-binding Lrp family transcriptional regulator